MRLSFHKTSVHLGPLKLGALGCSLVSLMQLLNLALGIDAERDDTRHMEAILKEPTNQMS